MQVVGIPPELGILKTLIAPAEVDESYEGLAVKVIEHLFRIADAMDRIGINPDEMWDEEDGFFCDVRPSYQQLRCIWPELFAELTGSAVMMLSSGKLQKQYSPLMFSGIGPATSPSSTITPIP
jgi:hypothetical protein